MLTITDPMMIAPAEAIVAAKGLKVISVGTTTIALAGAAVGIRKIFSSLIHSVARSLFATVRPKEAEGVKAGSGFIVVLVNAQPPSRRKRSQLHNFSIISSSSGQIETIKIQVGIRLSTRLSTSEHSVQVPQRSTTWLGKIFTHYPYSNLLLCIAPNYRSDPADEKENYALLLSRRTYPPRDSWNLCGLLWGKSTKARQIDRLLSRC
ncbi:hypothetical protein Tco_0794898 [Tanacetum coccineum]